MRKKYEELKKNLSQRAPETSLADAGKAPVNPAPAGADAATGRGYLATRRTSAAGPAASGAAEPAAAVWDVPAGAEASARIPDAWGAAYEKALKDYAAPAPFTYDPAADPAYQAYARAYAREGRRAGEDTLGRYAAMTGGMPSTAAVTAAQQASDYYAAKLSDRVPELYKLAYSMYADADARRLRAIEALRSARADELARWDAEQAYRTDARDFDYEKARDERADALAMARLGADNGDYSGLAALGFDVTRAAGTRWAYGADGSAYAIASAKGLAFIDSAQPGQTMTGDDGSVWTKGADGSVTIVNGEQTWTLAAPAQPLRYSGGGGKKTDKDDDAAASDGGDYPLDLASVLDLGYGPIGAEKLAALVDDGTVEKYLQGGAWRFRRRDGTAYDTPLFTGAVSDRAARWGL